MNWTDFKKSVIDMPVISDHLLKLHDTFDQSFKNQLSRWEKSGKIIRLKRGLYILDETERRQKVSRWTLSAEIYFPSYISLESALSFHGFIPDRISDITCITTRKTASFNNIFGKFTFRTIRPHVFRGFIRIKETWGGTFLMAEPEKAIVDLLYLDKDRFRRNPKNVLMESYRIDNLSKFKRKNIFQWTALYNNKTLTKCVKEVFGS